jgi:hypothetical protein
VLDSLLGEWINTNPLGAGVAKLIVTQDSREALLQIFGSGSPSFVDWGKAPIETIFAKDVTSSEPMAFEARFNLGFLAVHAQANFSLGLLVLACFNTFKDGSGRRNYFSREFFHRNDIEEAAN